MLTPQKLEPRMTSVSKTRQISARDSQERRPWPVRSKLDKYIYFLIRFTQPKINYLFTSHADPGGKELNKHILNRNGHVALRCHIDTINFIWAIESI